MKLNVTIRTIQATDNATIASLVKDTLTEFGANKPGTAYFDPSTDTLFEVFQKPRSVYNIAEMDGKIIGGAGVYPTDNLDEDTCELVKMYLRSHVRGLGLGRLLIEKCIEQAKEFGYKKVYLESMPELRQALKVYEKFGFEYLKGPMGNSGHTGCSLWMLKKL